MEDSMIYFQKNILEHSLGFFGEDKFARKSDAQNNRDQSLKRTITEIKVYLQQTEYTSIVRKTH
jgi:hypothetical protein